MGGRQKSVGLHSKPIKAATCNLSRDHIQDTFRLMKGAASGVHHLVGTGNSVGRCGMDLHWARAGSAGIVALRLCVLSFGCLQEPPCLDSHSPLGFVLPPFGSS